MSVPGDGPARPRDSLGVLDSGVLKAPQTLEEASVSLPVVVDMSSQHPDRMFAAPDPVERSRRVLEVEQQPVLEARIRDHRFDLRTAAALAGALVPGGELPDFLLASVVVQNTPDLVEPGVVQAGVVGGPRQAAKSPYLGRTPDTDTRQPHLDLQGREVDVFRLLALAEDQNPGFGRGLRLTRSPPRPVSARQRANSRSRTQRSPERHRSGRPGSRGQAVPADAA